MGSHFILYFQVRFISLLQTVSFFSLWAKFLADEYSNKSAVVDRCFDDAKSNQRFAGVADADIRQVCEEALPTYLTTRLFAVILAGILIAYFNMVLIGFYRQLAANPSNYAFPWFAIAATGNATGNSAGNSTENVDQYQLEEIIDPSPEYQPPLPPYREKTSNTEQAVVDQR